MKNPTLILNYLLFFSFPVLLIGAGLFGALRKLPPNYPGFLTRRLAVLIVFLGIVILYLSATALSYSSFPGSTDSPLGY